MALDRNSTGGLTDATLGLLVLNDQAPDQKQSTTAYSQAHAS